MSKTFRLDESFIDQYKNVKPAFGFNGFGELVYMRTYSRLKDNGQNEVWWETVRRVVEGCYEMQRRHIKSLRKRWDTKKAQASAQEMFDRIFTFKFTPPGRGLWAMGSVLTTEKELYAALNNCLAGETEVITRNGIKPIAELAGTTQTLLTLNGQWVEAPISRFGTQELMKITLTRQGVEKVIYATPNHEWFAKSKSELNHSKPWARYRTDELKEGSRLQYMFGQGVAKLEPCAFGIAHGITFGDGTTSLTPHLYLCGEKDAQLAKWFPHNSVSEAPEKNALRVANLPRAFRKAPDLSETRNYLLGWLMGYFAADGKVGKTGQPEIESTDEANIRLVRDVCAILGIGTYSILTEDRISNLTQQPSTLFSICLMRQSLFEEFFLIDEHRKRYVESNPQESAIRNWNVKSVERTDRVEEVFCATVDGKRAFTLADNILTSNCAFVSTETIADDLEEPFAWLMDASMVGIGVGFDVKGAGKVELTEPGSVEAGDAYRWLLKRSFPEMAPVQDTVDWQGNPVTFNYLPVDGVYTVPDTREGWVMAVIYLLAAYMRGFPMPDFRFEQIRPEGLIIKGFGGMSSGPEPLKLLIHNLFAVCERYKGRTIDAEFIADAQNMIGCCVVAGNVRRTAEIMFGDPNDEQYLKLKDFRWNAEEFCYEGSRADRSAHGWSSNNSVFAEIGMDYTRTGDQAGVNGEPGFAWLHNMQEFGRMIDRHIRWKDARARGGNPCLEQTLESYELCCLVETYINNHDSLEDYQRTLKFAYLYAKTVTLGMTHWEKTNEVMLRNRRIGCSQSGIQQFIARTDIETYRQWCDAGYATVQRYDEVYSEWFAIPRSIKTTSIKPSGTVSLLAGATPGMHWPEDLQYIRRMRLSKLSPLVQPLIDAGYLVEPAKHQEETTVVVEVPVQIDNYGGKLRPVHEVSMWEQVSMAAFIQRWWADNQVSCTVTIDPIREGPQVKHALNYFQYDLKGISFLPKVEKGAYAQMPYEAITPAEYAKKASNLRPLDFTTIFGEEAETERFCDGGACVLPKAA